MEEAAKRNIKVANEDIKQQFRIAYNQQAERYPFYGQKYGMTPKAWWKEIVYNTFVGAGVPKSELDLGFDGMFETLYHRYSMAEGYHVFDDVIPNLQALRQDGFRMGIVSNTDERIVDIVHNLGLAEHVDFIMSCIDAACEKPDKRFFEKAQEMCGIKVNPEQIVHIGDDEEA
ncbi:Haloacid dehalogenase-like hydrolase domain-containing protein 3 [Apophysomyces ossiformis]|uniref:Haloacid dehalogenase-like hydrolase domain-containing protein 3 n=1 Tax=Apophysomyces ossiformis TaxID=679940 RepID=A0A8H7EVF3_9FUNG|nr:Haloacid dehalogenase-like hydrolase domain-containing protein 3 [Apophysomyces ossiformis]